MGGVGSGDKLARGGHSATWGPIDVSAEKWEAIFGKSKKSRSEYFKKYQATHKLECTAMRKNYRIASNDIHAKNWRAQNPQKRKAQLLLRQAVYKGKIKKGPCEFPPPHSTGFIHGHHDDYSKPLEVRWVCALHHKQIHNKEKEQCRSLQS